MREADDYCTHRFDRLGPVDLLGGLTRVLPLNPALVGPPVDNCDQLRRAGTDGSAQLQEPFPLLLLEKYPLLGHPSPQHFIFGPEQFDLASQLVLDTPCQIDQKLRKLTGHTNESRPEKARRAMTI